MKSLQYLLIAVAVFFISCSQSKIAGTNTKPVGVLKEVYKDAFLIGTAVTPAITSGADKATQEIVIKHFNSITVENVMKAALINPQSGVYNFGPADDYVAFGEKIKCSLLVILWYGIINAPPGFLPMLQANLILNKNRLKD